MPAATRRTVTLVFAAALSIAAPAAHAAEPEALAARATMAMPAALPAMLAAAVELDAARPSLVPPLAPVALPQALRGEARTTMVRRGLYVSFAALQALDAHSTITALGAGGREANPFMSGVASNRAALIAVKGGTAAATIFFAERLGRRNPVASMLVMAAFNSAYATIVAHNYRVAGR